MIDLFDYTASPLNIGLKILIVLLFIVIFHIYLDTKKHFGGEVRSFINLLFLFALFMAIGALFRIFGDGTEFGFTSDYSLRWFQSISFLVAGIFYLLAAKKLLSLFSGVEP